MAPETVEIELIGSEPVGDDGSKCEPVPLEVLERNLTSHAAHVAAAEAQWLVWLGEYCVREGWAEWGCSGPVQWLSWQCGMMPSTARDKVRVALAMRDLPVITKRFLAGRLSYSKVRALTRVATPKSDFDLAGLGVASTGAQLDLIVRSRKKAMGADQAAKSAWSKRSWRGRVDGEESMVFTFRVPVHDGDRVIDAVRAEVNTFIRDELARFPERSRQEVIESRGGWTAMCADAGLGLMIGTARSDELPPVEVELIVDSDHEPEPVVAASAEAPVSQVASPVDVVVGGRAVAPAVGYRLCCDPRVAALVEDSRGTVLGVGRKSRVVSRKLRRALERRDRGQCQFHGCGATRHLHAHHIVHWINGGPTELANLVLVCTFHHHVLHEGGWNVDPVTRDFLKPDGTVAEAAPTGRFRGSATETTRFATFSGPAPLAEAENEPFDLGLVLESLAWDDNNELLQVDAERQRISRVEHGPPLPLYLAQERYMQDYWARTTPTPDLYQQPSYGAW